MPKPSPKSSRPSATTSRPKRAPAQSTARRTPKPKCPRISAWAERENARIAEQKSRVADTAKMCGLQGWLEDTTPEWNWKYRHLIYIQAHLDKVTTGEITRLILCIPPRHGKSEMTTVRYPIYRLAHDPKFRIIVGAYNQRLANKFSRKMRKIVRQIAATLTATGDPHPLQFSRDSTAVEDWETSEGGGVRAVGVGGGVTGMGGNLIVIDDPVKSRKEANSAAYRETVWDWYSEDIYTRLEPGGAIVVIMTRWHEDDLVGRLIAEMKNGGEHWEVINLPALAEKDDPLGRAEGEALCPERYDETALARIAKVLKNGFFALFQQRPQPAEGSTFKRQWFQVHDKAPQGLKWYRYWDLALSTNARADYTCSAAIAFDEDGVLYIRDMVRDKWEWPDAKKIIIQTMLSEPKTVHGIELKMHGLAAVQELQREVRVAHIALKGVGVDGDKESRADAWSDRAESRKVVLIAGEWVHDFLLEVTQFPNAAHDDQVDTVSGGVVMAATGKSKKLGGG